MCCTGIHLACLNSKAFCVADSTAAAVPELNTITELPNITEHTTSSISKFLPARWGPWLPSEVLMMKAKPQVPSQLENYTKHLLDECVALSGVLQQEISKTTKYLT